MPFSTSRGGKITGREGLLLQGLPVNQMNISQLTDNQQRHLAGNAMTTTVLGAFMLGALTTFHEILKPDESRPQVIEEPLIPNMDGEEFLLEKSSDPGAFVDRTVEEFVEKAAKSSKLCYCEGRQETVGVKLYRCHVCTHTACAICRGNPSHDYVVMEQSTPDNRIKPQDFEAFIKESLPLRISFKDVSHLKAQLQDLSRVYENQMKSPSRLSALELIKNALTSDVCFRGARRREFWQLRYSSEHSELILEIGPSRCLFRLFVKVPSHTPSNDPARVMFEGSPIAQMEPKDNMIKGQWKVRVPIDQKFSATITSNGPVVRSFAAQRGLVEAVNEDEYVHSYCTIYSKERQAIKNLTGRDLCGNYKLYQDCAQAFNSFHKKDNVDGTEPDTFFYFDHTGQTGFPKEHGFVFTEEIRRLDHGETRRCFARTKHYQQQPIVKKDSKEIEKRISVVVDCKWIYLDDFAIASSAGHIVNFGHLPDVPTFDPSCQSQTVAFSCKLSFDNIKMLGPKGKWFEISQVNAEDYMHHLGWALNKIKVFGNHVSQNLLDYDTWHPIDPNNPHCDKCAPSPPVHVWAWQKQKGRGKRWKQMPFEMPESANEFEELLKTRPPGISTFCLMDKGSTELRIGINPTALCHRATANLKSQGPYQTSWCFVTDDTSERAYKNSYKLQSTAEEKPTEAPTGFTKRFKLRREQKQTLTWMLAQEKGVTFTEREFVEARQSQMGYLLMAQASQERIVRGGILASEVGYGKTIMTIALALSRAQADKEFADNYTGDLIPTKATLIFVPGQLPKQWRAEAEKFIRKPIKGDILLIERVQDLGRITIKQIQKATLVIVSFSVCKAESYLARLANLVGMVEPVEKTSDRAKDVWHEIAKEEIAGSMRYLKANPTGFQKYLDKKLRGREKAADGVKLPIPSKRIVGAAYQALSAKRSHDEMTGQNTDAAAIEAAPKAATLEICVHQRIKFAGGEPFEFKNLLGIVLEMFQWARVVIDEFTYVKREENPTISKVKAEAYWGLSGTAPYETYKGITEMASFVGVRVGPLDYSRLPKDERDDIEKDLSRKYLLRDHSKRRDANHLIAAEKLLLVLDPPSGRLIERRQDQAVLFLQLYVRRVR